MFGRRILILVPHPDDEVVACAAAIGRAQAGGSKVFALYMTHGCIARETLWPWQRWRYQRNVSRRYFEAESAAALLGIVPLGWSLRPARHLWRELDAVYKEVRLAINAHDIDQIWVPAYEGGNADHDGLNAVASLFKNEFEVFEFAEYNLAKGTHAFPLANGYEKVIVLKPAEVKKKQAALALYASEKLNLSYVDTARECFRTIVNYDYSLPPHAGKLWYERFRWVPFPHPRVDRTKSRKVSQTIIAFLTATANAPPASATQPVPERTRTSRGIAG